MKNDEKLYSAVETARKLSIHRDLLMQEVNAGKIKGNMRGKRIKFSLEDINEYKANQRVDKSKEKRRFSFENYKHIKKVPV